VLLEGLARLVQEHYPLIEITVVEGGGVSNHALVGTGDLPMAILNPPMTIAALAGQPPFAQAFPALRIGVANLTVNHLQWVVDRESPVHSLADWLQGSLPLRLPIDRDGTVDRMVFELALQHYGLSVADLPRRPSQTVPAANYHEQLALYQHQAVDALWQFMGIPSPSIVAAHTVRPIRVLPLPPDLIARLEALGWMAAEIPVGAYGVVEQPVATVAMGTSLGFHADVPTDVVGAIVRTLCEYPDRVRQIHPAAEPFDPARAHLQSGGPLHPGAVRYFQAQGLLP
jgi:TRAP transporter TAXI family solute receptor